MAAIHTDGYTISRNPRRTGGGYTLIVIDAEGNENVKAKALLKEGFTNNEAEVRGIAAALDLAQDGDTIITDSKICLT